MSSPGSRSQPAGKFSKQLLGHSPRLENYLMGYRQVLMNGAGTLLQEKPFPSDMWADRQKGLKASTTIGKTVCTIERI